MLDLVCDNTPFCITREYAPVAEAAGMARKADARGRPLLAAAEAVRRVGVRVQYVSNDHLGDLPASSLRQTCVGSACVVFRMSCEHLTCAWQAAPVSKTSLNRLEEVRVVASSAEALARAKTNVFVSASGTPISLAQLGEGQPAPAGAYRVPLRPGDPVKRARDPVAAVPAAPPPL